MVSAVTQSSEKPLTSGEEKAANCSIHLHGEDQPVGDQPAGATPTCNLLELHVTLFRRANGGLHCADGLLDLFACIPLHVRDTASRCEFRGRSTVTRPGRA
jgi:hypothetical protein